RLAARLSDSHRLTDHGRDQTRIAYRRERNKMSATRKAFRKSTRHLQREARLANPARTRNRDQTHILAQDEFCGRGDFLLSAYKSSPLQRNIARAILDLFRCLFGEVITQGCKFPREVPRRN